ncbi:hypothetical protein BX281_4206 [Streptomyces sp. Ag82_O1-15]|nr:hypothetical protein BX281_4206 [Streptomyces sp. Ag82_O1-15]
MYPARRRRRRGTRRPLPGSNGVPVRAEPEASTRPRGRLRLRHAWGAGRLRRDGVPGDSGVMGCPAAVLFVDAHAPSPHARVRLEAPPRARASPQDLHRSPGLRRSPRPHRSPPAQGPPRPRVATPSVASARPSGSGTRHSYAVRRIPCATPRRPSGRDRGRGVKTGGDRSVPRASGVSSKNPLTPSKDSAIPTRSSSSGSPTDGRLRLSQRSCDRAGFVTGEQIPTSWLPDYSLRPSKGARAGRRPYWQAAFESSSRSSYGGEVRRSPDAWSG